jgi:ABC-type phosphate transport system substrate-binding protein
MKMLGHSRPSAAVRTVAAVALLLAATAGTMWAAGPASAVTHSQINGSGSTWAGNAVNAWIGQVSAQGLRVTFTGTGSAQGRQNFALGTVDYAISDIGYQGVDSRTGQNDTSSRPYAFVPLVAGGTAFPYNISVRGQLVKNLRLSGQTLAKIFTNQITNWNDPAITADNNGQALPSIPIVPVVHSEGSGTTYQFSAYLAHDFPSIWTQFSGLTKATEYWPSGKGQQIAQNGSDGVMNYVASSAGQGTITVDEYSYGLAKGFPVAKIENSAGYFTLPTQYNVAVALTQAIINEDKTDPSQYLLQDLKNVYDYSDPRTYPMSSYSYGVIPTAASDGTMTTGKRQTLADFLYNSICTGQAAVGGIGYSALPLNLVQAGFQQIALLQAADPNVDLTNRDVTTCGNPTFVAGNLSENHLAQIAPQPLACDKSGAGPCGATVVAPTPTASASSSVGTNQTATANPTATSKAAQPTAKGQTSAPGKSNNPGGTVGNGSTPAPGNTAAPGAPASAGAPATGVTQAPSVDPITGETVLGAPDPAASGAPTDSGGAPIAYQATNVSAGQGANVGLAILAALLLLTALVAPPWLARRWRAPGGGAR